MDAKTALKQYLDTLGNPTTKTNYEIVLRDFLEGVRVVGQVTTNRIVTYKKSLADKAPQTVAARLAAIRSFCDYCWDQGWIAQDPSLAVKTSPIEKYAKAKNISAKDLKKVLNKIDMDSMVGIRDYLLIRLLYSLGNTDYVLGLKWQQDFPEAFSRGIERYQKLVLAENNNIVNDGYLFFNMDRDNRRALSLSGARRVLTKYATKAGFPEKYLDFQALKRLRAKQILEQTNDLAAVQKFCGHKSLKATKAFVKTLKG